MARLGLIQSTQETAAPPPERRTPNAPNAPTLLGGITGTIAWLASSLGALGAILYASGYLVSVAQLHLLGLSQLVTYSQDHYLRQGGSFFTAIGTQALIDAEDFAVVLFVLAIPAMIAYVLVRWTRVGQGKWLDRAARLGATLHPWWRGVAYAVLVYFLFQYSGDPQSFGEPLSISNLLFTGAAQAHPGPVCPPQSVDAVASLLVSGDQLSKACLTELFDQCLTTYLLVAVLLSASLAVTAPWRWRKLAVTPFVLLFLIYTVLLPMVYGVFKVETQFPIVTIQAADSSPVRTGSPTFLLNKDGQELILFDGSDRKILWVRQDWVNSIEVSGFAPILRTQQTATK